MSGALRVLGIDPGLTRMGYGAVEESGGSLRLIGCGTITTDPADSLESRLFALHSRLVQVFTDVQPDTVGIEKIHLKQNALSAVPAIQASGLAWLIAGERQLPIDEYSPAQVKKAVVGTGSATKDQVRYMVERLLAQGISAPTPDASDALGVAIAHLNYGRVNRLAGVR